MDTDTGAVKAGPFGVEVAGGKNGRSGEKEDICKTLNNLKKIIQYKMAKGIE